MYFILIIIHIKDLIRYKDKYHHDLFLWGFNKIRHTRTLNVCLSKNDMFL